MALCHISQPQIFHSKLKEKLIQSEASGGLLSIPLGKTNDHFLARSAKSTLVLGKSTHDLSFFFLWISKTQESSVDPALQLVSVCHRANKTKSTPVSFIVLYDSSPATPRVFTAFPWSFSPENAASLFVSCQCQWQRFSLISHIQHDSVCCSRSVAPPTGTTRSWVSYSIPSRRKSRKEPSSTKHTLLLFSNKLSRCQGLETCLAFQGKAGYPSGSMSHAKFP